MLSHEEFTKALIAYKANNVEPKIDRRDMKLKFYHYGDKQFVPFRNEIVGMIAREFVTFYVLDLWNN